jgi:hypothetical protein
MIRWGSAKLVGAVGAGVVLSAAAWLLVRTRPAALAVAAAVPAGATADEVRTFAVTVDGKPGGTYTIATATAADGTETVTVAAMVKVKTLVGHYTYELNSTEAWKGGRLVSLRSAANDDGKKHAVTAVATEAGLKVTAGKEARLVAADAITSTGARPPAADKARDAVVLDTEDGSDTAARVEPLGPCRVTVGGKAVDGTRFKLTGKDLAAEWWFDAAGRPIHQEMTWDGHKVVLELTGVK